MYAGGIPYGCLKVELEELSDKGHPLVMQKHHESLPQPSQEQQGVAAAPW